MAWAQKSTILETPIKRDARIDIQIVGAKDKYSVAQLLQEKLQYV